MGLWRGVYKLLGIYNSYPETIPQDNINKKNMMIKELKTVFENTMYSAYCLKNYL